MRTPYSGSVPVAGRPFLRLTVIDFAIITYNVKASRGEGPTSASALTRATKDRIQMTQADSVLSTPPTNTPVDTTRRSFLSNAAGLAAGGTVLALATVSAAADAAAPVAALVPSDVDPI